MRLAALVVALLLVPFAAACGDDETPSGAGTSTTPTATAPTATSAPERTVEVWFADDAAMRLVPERRTVTAEGSDLAAAMAELAEGPAGEGTVPALPAGTRVLGAEVDAEGTATVDLSREFEEGYPAGGAAAELAVVGPIVYTATGVAGVERVLVTVEGAVPDPAGTQFDWSRPLARADLPSDLGTAG